MGDYCFKYCWACKNSSSRALRCVPLIIPLRKLFTVIVQAIQVLWKSALCFTTIIKHSIALNVEILKENEQSHWQTFRHEVFCIVYDLLSFYPGITAVTVFYNNRSFSVMIYKLHWVHGAMYSAEAGGFTHGKASVRKQFAGRVPRTALSRCFWFRTRPGLQ